MKVGKGFVHVDFSMFIDRMHVQRRLSKYKKSVLGGVGAYSRRVMKSKIRPPKKSKKARAVVVDGIACQVGLGGGLVLDAKTQRPVARETAEKARQLMRAKLKSEGRGKPPRRGPTDLLRKHIYFGVEPTTETVVIGPMKFSSQPRLSGVVSVPQLLEEGGREEIYGKMVRYEPHPYVGPTLPTAEAKFAELVKSTPLN